MAYNFTAIESKWQKHWLDNKTFAAIDPAEAGDMPKAYVLDMFPYPSGAGLHVGHPVGYMATDIVSRYLRAKGVNVLHPIGWDAFGLPAEQYAVQTNTHPHITTAKNIEKFRQQLQSLGLGYDWDREIDTTDPRYYRWTQWIFLQLFNSYFDPIQQKALPVENLLKELFNETYVVAPDGSIHINKIDQGMEEIGGSVRVERLWRQIPAEEQREILDAQRLAYRDEIPVNWCPALGTVLANEEVIDGRSERGNYPVERRPMRQWMLRITAYADRLLADLDLLNWPESLKEMQRNWIGRSVGAEVDFEIAPADASQPPARPLQNPGDADSDDGLGITVFTTRPDTLYGATYMVLAPEHPLVDRIATAAQLPLIEAYRTAAANRSERERMAESKEKTGVFTGAFAVNPVNDERLPIYIADYVLMGYGTGAIMAVPAHDQRDFEFAKKFSLPIKTVVAPDAGRAPSADHAFVGEGLAVNSPLIDGLPTPQAIEKIIQLLEEDGSGHRSIKYKLRDWLFSRQRYWGEPFPIMFNERDDAIPLDESQLPLELPNLEDFKPTGSPEPLLSKARDWITVRTPDGLFNRETNTMPNWAGSCWYYLRYIDPKNNARLVDPAKEKYWMPVDLYVGGVEHAVLHLLYARFWHKVLFDLGHVSTTEPFARLVNQGLMLGEMEYHLFQRPDGTPVSLADVRDVDEEATEAGAKMVAIEKSTGQKLTGRRLTEDEVQKSQDASYLKSNPAIRIDARSFKMSKSRGNVVNPDEIIRDHGADCLRLYEMYMGPLESQKPWNTRDIIGMVRFLNSVWRNLIGDEENAAQIASAAPGSMRIADIPIPDPLDRQLHRTIKKVGEDIESLRFNTAIAELIKLNNELTGLPQIPRPLAESLTLLLAPFAPHIAEEIWQRLGHHKSLTRRPWPSFDPAKLAESMIELPVQVNGKVRDRIVVPADADQQTIFKAALAAEKVKPWIEGKTIRKQLYVEKRLVNFVL